MIDTIPDGWYSKCIVIAANTKAFFLIIPQKMEELLDNSNGPSDDLLGEVELAHTMAGLSLIAGGGVMPRNQ